MSDPGTNSSSGCFIFQSRSVLQVLPASLSPYLACSNPNPELSSPGTWLPFPPEVLCYIIQIFWFLSPPHRSPIAPVPLPSLCACGLSLFLFPLFSVSLWMEISLASSFGAYEPPTKSNFSINLHLYILIWFQLVHFASREAT